jgi:hypothetical protein
MAKKYKVEEAAEGLLIAARKFLFEIPKKKEDKLYKLWMITMLATPFIAFLVRR